MAEARYDMAKRRIEGIEIETRSGNVFAGPGLPDAKKVKIKSGLVIEISDFTNLSGHKLMECLNRLGCDIEIELRPAAEPIGHLALAIA